MALDTPLGYRSHQGTMLRFQALTMGLDVGHLHEVAVADRNVCRHVARSALQLDPAAADRRAPRRWARSTRLTSQSSTLATAAAASAPSGTLPRSMSE